MNYRAWDGSRTLEGNSRKSSESVSGFFPNFSGISWGKSQPYWGYGPASVIQFLEVGVLCKRKTIGLATTKGQNPFRTSDMSMQVARTIHPGPAHLGQVVFAYKAQKRTKDKKKQRRHTYTHAHVAPC